MSEITNLSLEMEPAEEQRPALGAYEDLSGRTNVFLGADDLTEEAVYEGCTEARSMGAAAVLVRPSDVDLVKNWVSGSALALHAIMGFPGGSSTTAARLYEARDLLRRGVSQLVVAMNLGKLLSRKFLYLESELLQLSDHCRQHEARLRLLFDVDRVEQDHVLIGVRLAKRTRANAIELYFRKPAVERVVGVTRYVAHHARGKVEVATHCAGMGWETAIAAYQAGAEELVLPDAGVLLGAWRAELQSRKEKEEALLKQQSPAGATDEKGEPSDS